jgi:tetratricopeptide (TPR) repeat protein
MTNIGRNSPCPCGSGKKFKQCCLKNGAKKDHFSEIYDLDQLSNRCIDLINDGQFDEAEVIAKKLIKDFPQVPDGIERMAILHEKRGDFPLAAKYYQKAADMIKSMPGFDSGFTDSLLDDAKRMKEMAK